MKLKLTKKQKELCRKLTTLDGHNETDLSEVSGILDELYRAISGKIVGNCIRQNAFGLTSYTIVKSMMKFGKASRPGFVVKGKTVFLPGCSNNLATLLEMSQKCNSIVLHGEKLPELDVVPVMAFVDILEKEAAKFDRLVDKIHVYTIGTASSSRKDRSTERWITNGNPDDSDDRVDSAQSWGIFG